MMKGEVMRIAVPDFVSSSFFPLIAAKELGISTEEGQDVELVTIRALGDVESLRDGAVDFSAGPAHSLLMIFPEWRGVKLVATVSQGTPWMLVMQSGLAKRGEIEAVKGRRIAADRGPDLVFKYLLRQGGIDIERDRVEIVPPPTTNPGISFGVTAGRALAEGKVDGLWANVLGCELAVHLGGASVVVDTRRGDGPPGAGNYSFAALATTESKIETEPERIGAVIRAVVRAQSVIRRDPARATEVARKLFSPVEAELMGQILIRDGEFYRPSISMEAIGEMNRFATAVGLLSSPVSYEQVVATQFRSLWSE
jgi:ABC-type nitrate/sulfonate/bicarbonate transport system substrate-binding protein